MNAKQFGLLLRQKIAAAPPDNVVPPNSPATRDPDWQAIRTNLANANLPAAAWQHAGLPAMTAEQLNNASTRDIWHVSQQLAKAPRATYRRGSDPRQVNAFNALRGKSIGLGKQYSPVFAGEGKPGYKPPLSSIPGLPPPAAAAPQQRQPPAPAPVPPQPPRVPAPPPPPRRQPPQHAVPGFQVGQPVPAGHVLNDQNILVRDVTKQRPPAQAVPRLPAPPRQ
jgi:hypothetical protein